MSFHQIIKTILFIKISYKKTGFCQPINFRLFTSELNSNTSIRNQDVPSTAK